MSGLICILVTQTFRDLTGSLKIKPRESANESETSKGSILRATIEYLKDLKRNKELMVLMQSKLSSVVSINQALLKKILQLEFKCKLLEMKKMKPSEQILDTDLAALDNIMEAVFSIGKKEGNFNDVYERMSKTYSSAKDIRYRDRQMNSHSGQTKRNDVTKQRLSTCRCTKRKIKNVEENQVGDLEVYNKAAEKRKETTKIADNKIDKKERNSNTFIEQINKNIQKTACNMHCKKNGCNHKEISKSCTCTHHQSGKLENILRQPCLK